MKTFLRTRRSTEFWLSAVLIISLIRSSLMLKTLHSELTMVRPLGYSYIVLMFIDAVSEERRVRKIIEAMITTEMITSMKLIIFFMA